MTLAVIPENLANLLQSSSALSDQDYELSLAIEEIKQNNLNDVEREQNLATKAKQQNPNIIELAKDILNSINTTEFLLLSLQRSFSMRPQQV